MTRLYITRHGQTEWNLQGRMQGSKDSPLTKKGIYQARQLGKRLADTKIDKVYCSSSGRALYTAELITENREIEIEKCDELMEMNFGDWEGRDFNYINENYKDLHYAFWNTPHLVKEFPGETFEEVKKRVVDKVNDIIKENEGKNILIVAHGISVKLILNHFTNKPLEEIFTDGVIDPASLSIVEAENGKYNLVKYGDTEHYSLKL